MAPQVLFITPTLSASSSGPQTFARYLSDWGTGHDAFKFVPLALDQVAPGRLRRLFFRIFPHRLQRRVADYAEKTLGCPIHASTVIHLNDSHSLLVIPPAGRFICQINDYEVADFQENPRGARQQGFRRHATIKLRAAMERRNLLLCPWVVCNSRYTAERIRHVYFSSLPQNRIRTIYKGVDLSAFVPRATDGIPPGSRARIAFVGNNLWLKGLDLLLAAAHGLRSATILEVAGCQERDLNAFLQKYPVPPGLDVRYAGRLARGQMPDFLRRADLLVAPSRSEAFGVALLEAIAVGLPVIASQVGGIPEATAGVSGAKLCAPSAAAVREALQAWSCGQGPHWQPSDREQVARFSTERMFTDLAGLYGEMSQSEP